jgi:hypothetical protein
MPIELPPAAVETEGAFGEDTSYVSRLLHELKKPAYIGGRLPCKILSLEFLKSHIAAGARYSEPMAGVGLTARVLGFGEHYLNDNSIDCLEALRLNFPEAIVSYNDMRRLDFKCGNLTFLDFNNFTFRRRGHFGTILSHTFANSDDYVILNDCTPFYFRYGSNSFETYSKILGSPIETIEDYFLAVAPIWAAQFPGWHLVAVGWFKDTSFQLFSRVEHPIAVRKFTAVDVPEGMVRTSP